MDNGTSTIAYSPPTRSDLHPLNFALWIGLASITMMFSALISAYIVRQAAGNWLEFNLPQIFMVNTGTVILCSVALHLSYTYFQKGKEMVYKGLLILGFILGLTFVYLQYMGWLAMVDMGVELKGNPSGSFIFAISGMHIAHVLGGIAVLIVALTHAFLLKFRVTELRIRRLSLTVQYWHYVDLLWIVLFLFFTLYR